MLFSVTSFSLSKRSDFSSESKNVKILNNHTHKNHFSLKKIYTKKKQVKHIKKIQLLTFTSGDHFMLRAHSTFTRHANEQHERKIKYLKMFLKHFIFQRSSKKQIPLSFYHDTVLLLTSTSL